MDIAKNILQVKRVEKFRKSICLPFFEEDIKAGDVIELLEGKFFIEDVKIDNDFNVFLEGVATPEITPFLGFKEETNDLLLNILEEEFDAFSLEIFKDKFKIFANKTGGRVFFEDRLVGDISTKRVLGKIVQGRLESGVSKYFLDKSSYLEILVEDEEETKKLKSNQENMAIIGFELCIFKTITYKGNGVFSLSNFIRNRSIIEHKLGADSFILVQNPSELAFLPKHKTKSEFIVKQGSKDYSIPLCSNYKLNDMIFIASKGVEFLKEGTKLYWVFASKKDFRDFEDEIFKSIPVEMEIAGEFFKTIGESYFVKGKIVFDFKVTLV
jgi:hypothetical protein